MNDWIAEHTDDEPDNKPTRTLGDVGTSKAIPDSRSIFEDVDA